MNLRFLLPEVPGLGVWQIDTGSKNSILNINSCAKIMKKAFGHISMIPLKLTFEPIEVNNPDDGKKQTVYVLNLRSDVTLEQLADAAREQSKTLMIESPSLENAFDLELEKDIDKLWGKEEVPTTTGEITEGTATEPEPNEYPLGIGTEPITPLEESGLDKTEDKARNITPEEVKTLKDALAKAGMTAGDFGKYCVKDKGWKIQTFNDLKKWQLDEVLAAIAKGKE